MARMPHTQSKGHWHSVVNKKRAVTLATSETVMGIKYQQLHFLALGHEGNSVRSVHSSQWSWLRMQGDMKLRKKFPYWKGFKTQTFGQVMHTSQ